MWWAEPLSKIDVRDSAAVDRVVVADSGAGVAPDAMSPVGGESVTVESLVGCMSSSCNLWASVWQSSSACALSSSLQSGNVSGTSTWSPCMTQ
eukprot:5977648-Pyramimonas_sp.AAC.1